MHNYLRERFETFHAQNPHVYSKLHAMSATLQSKGHNRVSMQMLFEVLRYDAMLQTTGDRWKLNNNYAAFYSRELMEQDPRLAGLFEIRQQRTD
jgi:hypothetical protein